MTRLLLISIIFTSCTELTQPPVTVNDEAVASFKKLDSAQNIFEKANMYYAKFNEAKAQWQLHGKKKDYMIAKLYADSVNLCKKQFNEWAPK